MLWLNCFGRCAIPKEYIDCVTSVEKSGKSHKDAQRICAIQYFKKHGKTPMQDEKKSASYDDNELALFRVLNAVGPAFVTATEMSLWEKTNKVESLFREQFRKDENEVYPASPRGPYIKDVYENYLICEGENEKLYKVNYFEDENEEVTFDVFDKWVEVEKTYVPVIKE